MQTDGMYEEFALHENMTFSHFQVHFYNYVWIYIFVEFNATPSINSDRSTYF